MRAPCVQVERAKAAAVPLRVTLPDGTQREGIAGVTTPAEIVATLARSLAKKAVAAKVDGRTWDLSAPLPGDCALQILTFDDPEGKEARASATLLHALPPAACKEHPKQHILWSPQSRYWLGALGLRLAISCALHAALHALHGSF
jgi:hypothetical protein